MDPGDGSFLAFASFEHVRGIRDSEGRPLGEVKAPASSFASVPTELVACDYPGARSTGAMNVTALLQINTHWRLVLATIRSIRWAFIGRTGRAELALLDLWRIAHAAVSVASFHCLERRNTDAIPVADAALFKASAGIKYALRHAEVSRLEGRDVVGEFPSAAALWRYIDNERLLLGASQVCAGPEMMIRELLDVLAGGAGNATGVPAVDFKRLLVYADVLSVWETMALLARAQAEDAGGRLTRMCSIMLRDVCAATGWRAVPDRGALEARLQSFFGRSAP